MPFRGSGATPRLFRWGRQAPPSKRRLGVARRNEVLRDWILAGQLNRHDSPGRNLWNTIRTNTIRATRWTAAAGTITGTRTKVPALGRAEFIVGRHYQRLEEASQLGCQFADDNQTLAFDYEDWRRIRDQLESQSRYALPAELFNSRLRRPEVPEQHHAVLREQICRPVIDESFARQPLRALRGMAAALATQLGLWNKFPQSRAENAYWSLPLRGVLRDNSWSNTNFICDVDPLAGAGPEAAWKQDLARRVRHDISYVVDSPNAQLFNEWFWAHRFVAPLLAVLFLVGLGWSLWNGQYPLFGLGLFVLANALALAILVVSNVERYSVPFGGLLLLLATHGMYALTRFRHRGGQGA